jgi:hypothetical protein
MANQRSKNKAHLGGFLPKTAYNAIVKLACKHGMPKNVFGFAVVLMKESIAARKEKAKRKKQRELKKKQKS